MSLEVQKHFGEKLGNNLFTNFIYDIKESINNIFEDKDIIKKKIILELVDINTITSKYDEDTLEYVTLSKIKDEKLKDLERILGKKYICEIRELLFYGKTEKLKERFINNEEERINNDTNVDLLSKKIESNNKVYKTKNEIINLVLMFSKYEIEKSKKEITTKRTLSFLKLLDESLIKVLGAKSIDLFKKIISKLITEKLLNQTNLYDAFTLFEKGNINKNDIVQFFSIIKDKNESGKKDNNSNKCREEKNIDNMNDYNNKKYILSEIVESFKRLEVISTTNNNIYNKIGEKIQYQKKELGKYMKEVDIENLINELKNYMKDINIYNYTEKNDRELELIINKF